MDKKTFVQVTLNSECSDCNVAFEFHTVSVLSTKKETPKKRELNLVLDYFYQKRSRFCPKCRGTNLRFGYKVNNKKALKDLPF